jgi:hypothetical protein
LDCLDSCLDGIIVLFYDMLSSPKKSAFTVLVTNHFTHGKTKGKTTCKRPQRPIGL